MTRFHKLVGTSLIAIALGSAQQPSPESNKERQPGTLRIAGVHETDRVMLDGELLGDGKRIQQFGGKLLINPGTYHVTVLSAGSMTGCESKVTIRENETAIARCAVDETSREQPVD